MAIYKSLAKSASAEKLDLQLLLLVNSYAQPDVAPDRTQISGTSFRNTLAPIDAVLAVRDGISHEAIARVCDYFQDANCKADSPKLHIVELENKAFELPLGWKLSKTTFALIRWMLGQPDACRSAKTPPAKGEPTLRTAAAHAQRAARPLGLFDRLAKAFDLTRGGEPLGGPGGLRALRLSNSCVMANIADHL